jgi:hypothetical protein
MTLKAFSDDNKERREWDAATYDPMNVRCLATVDGLVIIITIDGSCNTRLRLLGCQTKNSLDITLLLRICQLSPGSDGG